MLGGDFGVESVLVLVLHAAPLRESMLRKERTRILGGGDDGVGLMVMKVTNKGEISYLEV